MCMNLLWMAVGRFKNQRDRQVLIQGHFPLKIWGAITLFLGSDDPTLNLTQIGQLEQEVISKIGQSCC